MIEVKGYRIQNNHFLQQKLAEEKEKNSIYSLVPIDIRSTLDEIAFGIAKKEGFVVMDVKNKMVQNINNLSQEKAVYLLENLSLLIQKSTQENQPIDKNTVSADFISFLITLYY